MTIRAFLKTTEKKRDSIQTKEATPATPLTPADPKLLSVPTPVPAAQEVATEPAVKAVQESEKSAELRGISAAANQDAAPGAAEENMEGLPAAEGEVRL